MPRKSRYIKANATAPPFRVYNTALYVRLSVLDISCEDSNSIKNQENILKAYILGKEQFHIRDVYIDNGESGTGFARDSWKRLVADIADKLVDCVIVKDLSRFGRNYIEAGEYLENIFPFIGVRFIAVNDDYDSNDPKCSDNFFMHLKNLANDLYSRDISKKIASVHRTKQERGEFIGNHAAFGYIRSSKDVHKLIVDENAAAIVKEIYRLRLTGIRYSGIAKILNEKGVPCPGSYHYKNGVTINKRYKMAMWQGGSVKKILTNELYLGNIIQGKKRAALWQGMAQQQVPKEQWLIVKNTHEAIIDTKTFLKIQQMCNQRALQ